MVEPIVGMTKARSFICFATVASISALRIPPSSTREVDSADDVLHYTLLWDGLDDMNGMEQKVMDTCSADFYEEPEKIYIILGPEDSGTNFMQHLVHSNFPGVVCSHRSGGEIWKHSNNGADNIYNEVLKNMKNQTIEETTVVMMIRSPLSQIVSWKHSPHDMGSCVNRPYEEMNQSCFPTLGVCSPDQGHPTVSFKSTVEVYNRYLQQYQQIVADNRFKNAQIFTYEDAVYSTEEVIRDLAKLFDKPVPRVMDLQDDNAKDPRKDYRRQAQAKIRNRSYLEGVSKTEQQIMCQDLDYNIADIFLEGSYLPEDHPERKAHSYDCRASTGT